MLSPELIYVAVADPAKDEVAAAKSLNGLVQHGDVVCTRDHLSVLADRDILSVMFLLKRLAIALIETVNVGRYCLFIHRRFLLIRPFRVAAVSVSVL
jgi:hypothetical protein